MEIRRLGLFLRNALKSWAGVVVPPRSSWGTTESVDAEKAVASSDGANLAADGAWKPRSDNRTVCS